MVCHIKPPRLLFIISFACPSKGCNYYGDMNAKLLKAVCRLDGLGATSVYKVHKD